MESEANDKQAEDLLVFSLRYAHTLRYHFLYHHFLSFSFLYLPAYGEEGKYSKKEKEYQKMV